MSIPPQALAAIGPALQSALSVGTTAVGFMAASASARAQNAAIDQANENARVQTITEYDQLTRVGQQERAAATQSMEEAQINRKKAVARAEVSAGEAGVSGLSINALLGDLYGQEARIRDSVNQNLENTEVQLGAERNSVAINQANLIASRPKVAGPSLIGATLEAGSGVYGAYKDDLRTKARINRT